MKGICQLFWILYTLSWLPVNLSGQPFTCTGDFYLSQSGLFGPSSMFKIAVDSMTGRIIFEPLPGINDHGLNAIGYRITDNYIYGVDPEARDFYRINARGETEFLKDLDDVMEGSSYFAGDIAPKGDFMVILGGNQFDEKMVIINLEDPDYPTEVIPLTVASSGVTPDTRIADIAFDPLTSDLYAVDIMDGRLVTISLSSGIINDNLYEPSLLKPAIAALFFDAFGTLFAYGAFEGSRDHAMFEVDEVTGALKFRTYGPSQGGIDGCSCPYNLSLQKSVRPRLMLPCQTITFSLRIANGSQSVQEGISLEDQLPAGFTISEIPYNPFGGVVEEGIGSNRLAIRNMRIPTGVDSILFRVDVGNVAPGIYGNSATLSNLPPVLGFTRESDDPSTIVVGDSTLFEVQPLILPELEDQDGFCPGDSITLVASYLPGLSYAWSDGSNDSILVVTEAGTYSVTVSNTCESFTSTVVVEEKLIAVDLPDEPLFVRLGDSIRFQPVVSNEGMDVFYSWRDPFGESIVCTDCPNPWAFPFQDAVYRLDVSNEHGCSASDSVSVFVEAVRTVYTADVFSPNGDGINDYFYVQGVGSAMVREFLVVDRWGSVVFEQRNMPINREVLGWDGTRNSKALKPGVYLWTAEIEFLDGISQLYTGSITLLR